MDRTTRDQARRIAEARARKRREARTQTRLTRAQFRARERAFLARPQGLTPESVALVAAGQEAVLEAGWGTDLHALRTILAHAEATDCTHRLAHLLTVVFARDRRLRRADLLRACWLLARQEWVREPVDWKPSGKGARARFRSLVTWLLCRWPVPRFFDSAFSLEDLSEAQRWVGVYARLGRGESLRVLVSEQAIPTPLNKRARAEFLGARRVDDVMHALRLAQVTSWGGSRLLVGALRGTSWGRAMVPFEDSFSELVQWMIRQPDLTLEVVPPIVEWARVRAAAEPRFSMVGRTVASAMRGHRELLAQRAADRVAARLQKLVFPSSGLCDGRWETSVGRHQGTWTAEEIVEGRHLVAEGRAMRHCVAAYAEEIQDGSCSIWSLRCDGIRAVTVEVEGDRSIAQVRGRYNRDPTRDELKVLRRWAREAGLTLSPDFND